MKYPKWLEKANRTLGVISGSLIFAINKIAEQEQTGYTVSGLEDKFRTRRKPFMDSDSSDGSRGRSQRETIPISGRFLGS